MRPRYPAIAAAVVIFSTASALARQPSPALMSMPGMTMQASAPDQAYMDEMNKMVSGMRRAPMTGDADRDFVSQMMAHHQAAIAMAKTELKYGRDPELRKLAQNIAGGQQQEVSEMNDWKTSHSVR